jgi:hypothetical protein
MEKMSGNENKSRDGRIRILRGAAAVFAYIFIACGLFYCGYMRGSSSAAVSVAVPSQPDAEESTEAPIGYDGYEVIAEGGRLCLYEVKNDQKSLIESREVSMEIFPADDTYELKEGIRFDNIADAQSLFEDFAG